MLRVFLTIVLPFLAPTGLYLIWLRVAQPAIFGPDWRWMRLPLVWLGGTGLLLLAAVLLIVQVGFGERERGVYRPPELENGRIVPGHFEELPAPGR